MISIYETMETGYNLVKKIAPNDASVKILLRHSLRNHYENVRFDEPLTREGKVMAESFGRGLVTDNIRMVVTSHSPRCIETGENIIKGYGKPIDCLRCDELTYLWIKDKYQWSNTYENIYKKDIRKIIQDMLDKKEVLGAFTIEESINRLVDFMFSNDNEKISTNNSIFDIFISHDAFIMLLICYLTRSKLLDIKWLYMLEGVFLWKENNDLNMIWRGIQYKI